MRSRPAASLSLSPPQVGSWTWGWMEPPLGQISFFILCMQFTRDRMQNIGWQPYTESIKNYRADKLIGLYPQYHHRIMREYSLGDWFDPTDDQPAGDKKDEAKTP